jgi:COP9 signalosome complex subunit 5
MSKPGTSSETQKQIALKTWEMANKVEMVNSVDDIYRYDKKQQQDILAAKPWDKEYAIPQHNLTFD